MGTRSLTRVIEDGKHYVNMYRQFDGYPSGHGAELAKFLAPIRLVNGIASNEMGKIANGAGCLAAQLVAHFKKEPGGIYLYATDGMDCGQEYEYWIIVDDDKLRIRVDGHMTKLFEGTVFEFAEFCDKPQE